MDTMTRAYSEDDLLTVDEAAAYLKTSKNTICIWCRSGRLPAIKIGRQWRISKQRIQNGIGELGATSAAR